MKRIIALILSACLITAAVSCESGTNSTDLPSPTQNPAVDTTESQFDNSNGYVAAMSAAAGLDMENASVDDIISKFGQPSETRTETNSDVDCTILSYSFGELYFENRDEQQTLTLAIITDKLPEGIYGVNIGDEIYTVADTFYTDSSEQVKDIMLLAETGQEDHVLFYGSSQDNKYIPPYGLFKIIDIEQSDNDSTYQLEYAVPSTVGEHIHKIDLIFSRDMILTYIMIDCSEIF